MAAPDFFCIGALKAGTTWLYQQLSAQSSVRFADPRRVISSKEINYFTIDFPSSADPTIVEDDAWYLDLFESCSGTLWGDMSPTYAPLDETGVNHVHRLAPHARILYILRNPIERQWSALQMCCWTPAGWDESKFVQHLRGLSLNLGEHGKYCANLDRWRSRFGEQVQVFFYEQLCADPVSFYSDVCSFLGLDPIHRRQTAPLLIQKVFEGPNLICPDWMLDFLKNVWSDEIKNCHARFANVYTESWLHSLGID